MGILRKLRIAGVSDISLAPPALPTIYTDFDINFDINFDFTSISYSHINKPCQSKVLIHFDLDLTFDFTFDFNLDFASISYSISIPNSYYHNHISPLRCSLDDDAQDLRV